MQGLQPFEASRWQMRHRFFDVGYSNRRSGGWKLSLRFTGLPVCHGFIPIWMAGLLLGLLFVQQLPGSNSWAYPASWSHPTVTNDEQAKVDFFEAKIRPMLVKHCYECHSVAAKKQKGGLQLDSSSATRKGGDSGPAVVGSKPGESLLLSAIKYADFEMPPKGKLPDHVIADFEKWIAEGAVDPRKGDPLSASDGRPDVRAIDRKNNKDFWAFQAPVAQQLPEVRDTQWATNRIDPFVLHELERHQLEPAPRASVIRLNRRLSFDLIGLPPEEIEPDIDRLIDRLISSPAFGEKWSRLWLDLSRYAEDQAHIVGNNQSLFYPNAYLFRNWVINAFNADIPYDEFVQLQLAVDLIAKEQGKPPIDQDLAALGFIGLGPKYYRRKDPAVMADEWEDRVDTVSRGLLGITVACARCHDHKYDPISTEDYYALAGVFASTELFNKPLDFNSTQQTANPPNKNAKQKTTAKQTLHIVRDAKKIVDLPVYIRGTPDSKGAVVPRRFLSVLDPEKIEFGQKNSGRLELAKAITAPDNPLFARVIVNRVWGQLLGRPLVKTPSNFGKLGSQPSHPALLDDLSRRFIHHRYSLKWLIREIVSSSTYQQSSVASTQALQTDPENKLISRMNRKRLSIEQWRDAMLMANGNLLNKIGGQSIDPSSSRESRRTIYSKVSRFQLAPMLAMFDFPDPNVHAAQRTKTITPLQKMFALNSQFLIDQAQALEMTVETDKGKSASLEQWATGIYQRLFQRKPTPRELHLARAFLSNTGMKSKAQRIVYLQTLMISNEFTYVD